MAFMYLNWMQRERESTLLPFQSTCCHSLILWSWCPNICYFALLDNFMCTVLLKPVPITTNFISLNHEFRNVIDNLRQGVGFPPVFYQSNWPPRYNWNVDESGVKHPKHNQARLWYCGVFIRIAPYSISFWLLWCDLVVQFGYVFTIINILHQVHISKIIATVIA